ncbi:hypothetical protein THARTR1_09799 [Trichoderma harzianum]|uniref:DUF7924 domain-containing protein n=1 Tax=Trichoderma harzianum TaxID=5544 RepID=A0A2K0TVC2_TRIHA|nr:hypothetical protein THARTR1_09799 [Trichoderma harzianum]
MAETRVQAAAAQKSDRVEDDKSLPKQDQPFLPCQSPGGRKRKIADIDNPDSNPRLEKRCPGLSAVQDTVDQTGADNVGDTEPIDPISVRVRDHQWPSGFGRLTMEHALARKRRDVFPQRRRSISASSSASFVTPSDERPREEKSVPYRDSRYIILLNTKGAYMGTSEQGILDESKQTCRIYFRMNNKLPWEPSSKMLSLRKLVKTLRQRNEARVIQDVARLLVPSAEMLGLYAKPLAILTESVNAGWNNSIPLTGTRPQPDYSVGFRREAFTNDQLDKLSPFIGDFLFDDVSLFMATYYMYFPFLACEVKCGTTALEVADRQNAHSMTLAARGVVELFRLVKRENEINRQILSFSVSHDHRTVRIYGYYPLINGKNTKYYRHLIRAFDFTALDGRDKWTTHQFIKNVYDIWMPKHFKRICSAIDQLPSDLNFNVPALSESTGLSQRLDSLARSEADLAPTNANNQFHEAGQMNSLATSFSEPAPPAERRRNEEVGQEDLGAV